MGKYLKNLVPLLSRLKSLCQVQPVCREFLVQWDSTKMIYEIDLEWKNLKNLPLKTGAKSLMFFV